MALQSVLYRCDVELSDIDRGVYESLRLRISRHPSEDATRMVARILARALFHEEGLEFGKGLSTSSEAALHTHDLTGQLTHWIDVGHPGADRLHRARKQCDRVSVLCHRDRAGLVREAKKRDVHQASTVEVLLVDPAFIQAAADATERTSAWTLVRTDADLHLTIGEQSLEGQMEITHWDALARA